MTAELVEMWKPVHSEIAAAVGEDNTIWIAQLHLHAAGDEFVIGCGASSLGWIQMRFARTVQRAAGETPVRFVACGCEPQVMERAA